MNACERRGFTSEFEVRASGADGKAAVLEGHAAVFNSFSRDLGGFVERVHPAAFKKTLADNPDTRAFFNHDPSMILGRTRSGTLRLGTDSTGLTYSIDVPDTTVARDLMVSIDRGDVNQSSFGFYVPDGGDEWSRTEDGYPLRTLLGVNLHHGDVSPVSMPAYEGTDSGMARAAYRSFAKAYNLAPEVVAEAASWRDLRTLMDAPEAPRDEPQDGPTSAEIASAARARRLQLEKLRSR